MGEIKIEELKKLREVKRPGDGKFPLPDSSSYRGEIFITPPLNRDKVMKFE